jgi:hypothetical protein
VDNDTAIVSLAVLAQLTRLKVLSPTPAVSLVMAINGGRRWSELGAYVAAQLADGCLGTVGANAMFELPVLQFAIVNPAIGSGPELVSREAGTEPLFRCLGENAGFRLAATCVNMRPKGGFRVPQHG